MANRVVDTKSSGPDTSPGPEVEKLTTLAPDSARIMPLPEFIGLMALLSAVTALAMDAMLPAFPEMASDLGIANENRIQLVLSVFSIGMGISTLFIGSVADWLGRRATVFIGFGIYIFGSIISGISPSLEILLISRFVMGIGAAAVRITGMALIRDLYVGREMARIMSLVMMVFMIVPAMAPLMGEWVIAVGSWRMIFHVFVLFGLVGALWMYFRQPETLLPRYRRPLTLPSIIAGVREVLAERQIVLCMLAMTLGFGQMFSLIMSSKQLFSYTYGQGENFTKWFALMAVISGCGNLANAWLVMRVGMRRIIILTYTGQCVTSALFLAVLLGGGLPESWAFPVFLLWAIGLMSVAGLTFGNLNALAMQYKSRIAGTTASVISAVAISFGALIGTAIGQSYDGTVTPMVTGAMICSGLAVLITRRLT